MPDNADCSAWQGKWSAPFMSCQGLAPMGVPTGVFGMFERMRDRQGVAVLPVLRAGLPAARVSPLQGSKSYSCPCPRLAPGVIKIESLT